MAYRLRINKTTILGTLFFLAIFTAYIFPNAVTVFYKPVYVLLSAQMLKCAINRRGEKLYFLFLAEYLFIFMHGGVLSVMITNIVSCIMYTITAVIATSPKYSVPDCRILVKSVINGSFAFSVLSAICMPFFREPDSRVHVNFGFTAVNANTISQISALGLILTVEVLIFSGVTFKYLIVASIQFYALWFSGSRAAVICVVLGCLPFIMYKYKESIRKRKGMLLILVPAAAILAVYVIAGRKYVYLGRGFNLADYLDFGERGSMWTRAVDVWKINPIFGGGFSIYGEMTGIWRGCHNMFLWALDTGGVIFFAMITVLIVRYIFKVRKNSLLWWPAVFIIVQGMAENLFNYFFWIPLILGEIVNAACSTADRSKEVFTLKRRKASNKQDEWDS